MNLVRQKVIRFIFGIVVTLALVGCTSSEQFYEDVRLSRDAAYRQWKSRKQRQEQSQTHINGKLSIEDCLKLALANNKTLQRVIQEKGIARGERLKSYSAVLPTVGLSGEYKRLDKVMSMELPEAMGGGTITMGDLDNYSAALKVTQPIFAGGAIIAKINAGKLFSLLADRTASVLISSKC